MANEKVRRSTLNGQTVRKARERFDGRRKADAGVSLFNLEGTR